MDRTREKPLGVDAEIYDADLYDGLNRRSDDLPFYLAAAKAAHARPRAGEGARGGRQTGRVTWVHHVGRDSFASRLDMRCFFPLELEALLRYNGFRVLRKYGDFRKGPFVSGSPKQIFVCELRPTNWRG